MMRATGATSKESATSRRDATRSPASSSTARRADLYQRYHEGMEDQLGALGLGLNCVVLWNTVYMNAALDQLRAAGHPVLDEDAVRLSPFVRRHLGVHGDYSFLLPELAGTLRELRDPDSDDGAEED
jgi:hypothetical protein